MMMKMMNMIEAGDAAMTKNVESLHKRSITTELLLESTCEAWSSLWTLDEYVAVVAGSSYYYYDCCGCDCDDDDDENETNLMIDYEENSKRAMMIISLFDEKKSQ